MTKKFSYLLTKKQSFRPPAPPPLERAQILPERSRGARGGPSQRLKSPTSTLPGGCAPRTPRTIPQLYAMKTGAEDACKMLGRLAESLRKIRGAPVHNPRATLAHKASVLPVL